ncbi:MAG TPA: cytochrome-c peroxidase [Nevskia sp.]|nr:cytochrome-c peroxidase [Nevskia sp.]
MRPSLQRVWAYRAAAGRAGAGLCLAMLALGAGPAARATSPDAADAYFQREPIRPIPLSVEVDARKAALGRKLFQDPLLSADGTLSCGGCHMLGAAGVDHRQKAVGMHQAQGRVNTPTVYNSAFNFREFWDGRAENLDDQVDWPLQGKTELGSTWEAVLDKLRRTPAYVAAFDASYPDGISRSNVRNAIAEFERSLITPNSRFDRYLRGQRDALNPQELSGYRKFKAYGCVSCHQGVNVGGNMFQRMGVMGDYFADRGHVGEADYGRFNVTHDEADRYTFKVPSLRNVALTGPYFHDGSAQTLEQAVTIMARYQLGRELPPDDREQLVAFLRTLTGEFPGGKP